LEIIADKIIVVVLRHYYGTVKNVFMWFFKKKKQELFKKNEIPPEPPISEVAVAVVWNEDKTRFCEIIFDKDVYTYGGWQLNYDDSEYVGYYWGPIGRHLSFYDTEEKAKREAEIFLLGKGGLT